jgi:orotate phosphoribosyltransferase
MKKEKSLIEDVVDMGLFCVVSSMDRQTWFPLKSGPGPLFFDTSKIIAYPDLMEKITQFATEKIKEEKISFDLIVGAPYGGMPLSYFIASALHAPCLTLRKDGSKKTGTMATFAEILGIYKKGDKVLIIEDAISSANTVIEFARRLRKAGLVVTDVLAIVDVGRGGAENLKVQNIHLNTIFTWKNLYKCYKARKPGMLDLEVKKYLDDMFGEK